MSFTLPTICNHMCNVSQVSLHASNGKGGHRSSILWSCLAVGFGGVRPLSIASASGESYTRSTIGAVDYRTRLFRWTPQPLSHAGDSDVPTMGGRRERTASGQRVEADGLDTCRRRGFETLPPCAASRPPCSGEVEQFTLSDAKVASGNQRAVVEFERHSAGAEDHEEGCSCDPCPGAVPRLSCHVVAPNAEGSVQVRAVWTINIEAMRREADPLRTTP